MYVLGVKDSDTYLPSDDEVKQMINQGQMAAKNKEPSPSDKKDLSMAALNDAKTQQVQAETVGNNAKSQLEYMSMAQGNPKVY